METGTEVLQELGLVDFSSILGQQAEIRSLGSPASNPVLSEPLMKGYCQVLMLHST